MIVAEVHEVATEQRGRDSTEWPKISENTALYDSVIVDFNSFKLYSFILLMTSHDVICSSEFVLLIM